MGWSSGSNIAIPMVTAIRKHVADESTRLALYEALVKALEEEDWDTQFEAACIDPVFDALIGFDNSPNSQE